MMFDVATELVAIRVLVREEHHMVRLLIELCNGLTGWHGLRLDY